MYVYDDDDNVCVSHILFIIPPIPIALFFFPTSLLSLSLTCLLLQQHRGCLISSHSSVCTISTVATTPLLSTTTPAHIHHPPRNWPEKIVYILRAIPFTHQPTCMCSFNSSKEERNTQNNPHKTPHTFSQQSICTTILMLWNRDIIVNSSRKREREAPKWVYIGGLTFDF